MINLIYILLLISLLLPQYRGWIHPETGWETITGTHMSIFMLTDVFINNEEAEQNHTDAIGFFLKINVLDGDTIRIILPSYQQ